MPARIHLFICEVKAYQICTTLSPQLGQVKVTFFWNMIACYTEHLHFIVTSFSSPLN